MGHNRCPICGETKVSLKAIRNCVARHDLEINSLETRQSQRLSPYLEVGIGKGGYRRPKKANPSDKNLFSAKEVLKLRHSWKPASFKGYRVIAPQRCRKCGISRFGDSRKKCSVIKI